MCTNQKNFTTPSKPSITTLIRPRSDPYIPTTLLASMTNTINRTRESRSFDEILNSSLSNSSLDELGGSNTCALSSSTDSPNKKNIVKSCKNCQFSFHVKSISYSPNKPPKAASSDEFCCKDCETCFTLFNPVSTAATPTKPVMKQSTFDVRQSIYAFQRELLQNEQRQQQNQTSPSKEAKENQEASNEEKNNTSNKNSDNCNINNDQNEIQAEQMNELKAAKKRFNIEYFQSLKQQKRQHHAQVPPPFPVLDDQSNTERAGNNNVMGWLFNQPKPARPQLHTFI